MGHRAALLSQSDCVYANLSIYGSLPISCAFGLE